MAAMREKRDAVAEGLFQPAHIFWREQNVIFVGYDVNGGSRFKHRLVSLQVHRRIDRLRIAQIDAALEIVGPMNLFK